MKKPPFQQGVALVITLIMLSVVTFMAVAFLSLSRRDRNSVSVSADHQNAGLMAEAALAHAQSKIVARLLARNTMLGYEFMVSTNLFNATGYDPRLGVNPTNVNYQYRRDASLMSENDRVAAIANLQYDPRPPVYVDTNMVTRNPALPPAPLEFRYYWDFNRNGLCETNGYLPILGDNGQPLAVNNQVLSNLFVGDPEWIGILEKPNQPHSGVNKFIGRFAYLVMPVGKSLDLNYIYNQSKYNPRGRGNAGAEGYLRNQGVGSWEINLAAFFRGLNTNEWLPNDYLYTPNYRNPSRGKAFLDALSVITNRGSIDTLSNAVTLFGAAGANAIANDYVDDYTVGPLMSTAQSLPMDDDRPDWPWPGSESPRPFSDIQELFSLATSLPAFGLRIQGTENLATTSSSYDRYTLYRLMAQMGVDSAPASPSLMNINFPTDNVGNVIFTNWTPLAFFTNAADLLLRSQSNYLSPLSVLYNLTNQISITNIPIYPTNLYTPALHRLLQVAANIYDATTNRVALTGYPYLPSVFRPVFTNDGRTIYINGYVEVTNMIFWNNNRWLDINVAADRAALNNVRSNANIYGIPLVVGVKKGLPNFNEFSLQTAVQISRKLEIRKDPRSLRPNQTNQLYIVGVSNTFGLEAWNSYKQAFPRDLDMYIANQFYISMTNWGSVVPVAQFASVVATNMTIAARQWTGNQYRVPLNTNIVFLSNAAYFNGPPSRFVAFSTNYLFEPSPNFFIPQWGLSITNRLQFMLVDRATGRVVDFVNLNNLGAQMDLTRELIGNQNFGESSSVGSFWQTNRLTPGGIPSGVRQQILESLGQTGSSDTLWMDYSHDPIAGLTKEKAIDLFRVFLGLTPMRFPLRDLQQELGNSISHQVPFTPTRKIYQNASWQANDPLVHYMAEDLVDLVRTNNIQYAVPPAAVPTNSNLGQLNRRWQPWGGNPNVSSNTTNDYNLAIKDPMVRNSDDWNFPTNKFPNIGWLGRVHRGTPWQTVYLKSAMAEPARWVNWSGYFWTHPTNDWRMVGLFTTALSPSAARGMLSVNQANVAAWTAVLGSLSVLTNAAPQANNLAETFIQPESIQLHRIVDSINATRASRPGGAFQYLGEILATPALTTNSPYLNLQPGASINIPDEAYERIPQQILSLLKADDPWVVVYTYGQSLAPSGPPVLAPGQPYDRMYTNYHVTAEVLTKHFMRITNASPNPNVIAPMAVRQRFQYLPNE